MQQDELVSIGIPTYNSASRIRTTLDMLQAQTHKNTELIISDDASTDETQAICEEYAAKDKRIRYIRQNTNLGHRGNFAFVARKASGEYFMWAADDDWWDTKFISTLCRDLQHHPKHGLAMTSFERRYEDNKIIDTTVFQKGYNLTEWSYTKVLSATMNNSEPMDQLFYGLFRTVILQKLLKRQFPTSIAYDRVFMCEIALTTHICTSPEVMWRKTVYRKSLKERYGEKDIGKSLEVKRRRSCYIITVLFRLFSSRSIPLMRKLYALPIKSLSFLWHNKGYMLHELSSPLYKIIKL